MASPPSHRISCEPPASASSRLQPSYHKSSPHHRAERLTAHPHALSPTLRFVCQSQLPADQCPIELEE
eukprot:992628-Amphidinium_carterae.1